MLEVIHSDALTALRDLPDESVQCCVTSPPYWGLRSYGTETVVWDNHNGCEHQWVASQKPSIKNGTQGSTETVKLAPMIAVQTAPVAGDACACGAWRGELGLEPTPDLYVRHIVEIFREVRRVLRNDGTCWINLGDSYFGDSPARKASSEAFSKNWNPADSAGNGGSRRSAARSGDLKPKDLVGIPWMAAFALRADGWYLRSDIIWSKPNPMPESVTDRPTKSHEYIFLLSKSAKYFYDADAISEPSIHAGESRVTTAKSFAGQAEVPGRTQSGNAIVGSTVNIKERRNKRSVWTVGTQSFADAHFATFPPDLIKPCILAGAPVGGVVLDPFAGSGTTGKVAIELGRKAILIEPKAEYVEMINKRCQTTIGLPLTYGSATA